MASAGSGASAGGGSSERRCKSGWRQRCGAAQAARHRVAKSGATQRQRGQRRRAAAAAQAARGAGSAASAGAAQRAVRAAAPAQERWREARCDEQRGHERSGGASAARAREQCAARRAARARARRSERQARPVTRRTRWRPLTTSQVYTGKANDCVRLAVNPTWSTIDLQFQPLPGTGLPRAVLVLQLWRQWYRLTHRRLCERPRSSPGPTRAAIFSCNSAVARRRLR